MSVCGVPTAVVTVIFLSLSFEFVLGNSDLLSHKRSPIFGKLPYFAHSILFCSSAKEIQHGIPFYFQNVCFVGRQNMEYWQ